ncbi:hypothetical protein C7212DRAFT_363408 [Tuber magnatum]|uniref:Uncharacterized protein n=1 Tax=Tuber magnatum TaxID=42249 RepID=A0A317SRE1_9PEZI|nr:hypothetical protein C7212DRAFT_363408 [Tuber magnatum]
MSIPRIVDELHRELFLLAGGWGGYDLDAESSAFEEHPGEEDFDDDASDASSAYDEIPGALSFDGVAEACWNLEECCSPSAILVDWEIVRVELDVESNASDTSSGYELVSRDLDMRLFGRFFDGKDSWARLACLVRNPVPWWGRGVAWYYGWVMVVMVRKRLVEIGSCFLGGFCALAWIDCLTGHWGFSLRSICHGGRGMM